MNTIPPQQRNPYLSLPYFAGGLLLLTGIVLMFTNPSQKDYEDFATEELIRYAKENVCSPKSGNLEEAIKAQVCNLMLHTSRNQIPKLIKETTERRNYLLLSIYETNLFLYEFETIAAFNNFYIIEVRTKVYDE